MIFEKLKEIIIDQLDVDESEVTLSADIQSDLGADSLDVVDLIMSLEDEFEMEIPDEAVENIKTIFTSSLLPNCKGVRFVVSILITARSHAGSFPTRTASKILLSFNMTFIFSAFCITWLFVMMYPFSSMITPEPEV